ncbi:unnamed protein product [Calicophoron daubneyi]|uniref:RETREG1-3/ARL6IP-like N-terminal reticulon-homology domain-containing protein n=1 Tax=Calicophoron daubneyi TaxID=300641 RepID=A0AAV2TUB6_CALDB
MPEASGLLVEKLYGDVFAVLRKWEFLILRLEALLIWERIVPSVIFTVAVHATFWAIALTQFTTLFVFCFVLLLVVIGDFSQKWIVYLLEDRNRTPGSFTDFVLSSLEKGQILSISDLSRVLARALYYVMKLLNGMAPCRRSRPLLFFVVTSTCSLLCILLSFYLPGLAICYGILNICLITPALLHHRIALRVWDVVKPILVRIEAEFDKHPFESVSERQAGEAELYQPIIEAAEASHPELLSSEDREGFLSDEFLSTRRRRRSGSEELDTSEAVFIKQFVPKMTDEEIDRLFAGVLGEGDPGSSLPPESASYEKRPRTPSAKLDTSLSESIPIMSDEYATDEDETDGIMDEDDDQEVQEVEGRDRSKEHDLEGFVFVPKSK